MNIFFRYLKGNFVPAHGHIEIASAGLFVAARIYLPFGRVLEFAAPADIDAAVLTLENISSLTLLGVSFDDAEERYAVHVLLAEMQLRWRTDGAALLRYAAFSFQGAWSARLYETGFGMLNKDIKNRLNGLLRAALRGGPPARAEELIGCPIAVCREHFKNHFQSGRTIKSITYPDMSWENMGYVWHIDHIKPCNEFNLTYPEQQKQAYHYSNLQPLFASENLRKSNKWGRPVAPLVHSHVNVAKAAPPPLVSKKQEALQNLLDEFLETWFEENPAEVEWRGPVTRLMRGLYEVCPEAVNSLKLEQLAAHLARNNYSHETGPRRIKIWSLSRR